MLTPDFLLRIVDAAEEAADKLNTYLVQRVSKRILTLFDKEKGSGAYTCINFRCAQDA